jgi:hypothetical protein
MTRAMHPNPTFAFGIQKSDAIGRSESGDRHPTRYLAIPVFRTLNLAANAA